MKFLIKLIKAWPRMAKTTNYNRSNAITRVNFKITPNAKKYAGMIYQFDREEDRQKISEALLNELSNSARINFVNLKISDAKQYHKKYNGRTVYKQLGYYRPKSQYIYITNRTAVQGKILAPKTFLTTLLHEWMHHYDFHKLRINSIHTKGFYERLKDLKIKLEI